MTKTATNQKFKAIMNQDKTTGKNGKLYYIKNLNLSITIKNLNLSITIRKDNIGNEELGFLNYQCTQ